MPEQNAWARWRNRNIRRDVAWNELRNIAILIWPPGWSHTRLEADRG